jgi:hypothetical protein
MTFPGCAGFMGIVSGEFFIIVRTDMHKDESAAGILEKRNSAVDGGD